MGYFSGEHVVFGWKVKVLNFWTLSSKHVMAIKSIIVKGNN